jgi:hypothetical protein
MRLPWTLGAAILLVTLIVSGQSSASEATSSHLRTLAARQDLCDMVCFAKAEGSISRANRIAILSEAREILSHDEYLKFKKALDRIAPPPKPSPKQLAKTSRKKPALPIPQPQPQPPESASGLVIPTGATLPDRMAPPMFSR